MCGHNARDLFRSRVRQRDYPKTPRRPRLCPLLEVAFLISGLIVQRLPSGYTPPRQPSQATLPQVPRRSSDDESPVLTLTFTPISVSRTFRDAIAAEYPGLGKNRAYWRFLQYLFFGTWRDVENGQLLLPQSLIAAITDQPCDSNFSAAKFFNSFKRDVGIKVDIADKVFHPDPVRSRSRSLLALHLPAHFTALVSHERSHLDDDRVWMDTGLKWLRKHASERRGEDRERAEGLLEIYRGCPETVALAEYLNGLPPNRFSSVLRHIPKAMEYAAALAEALQADMFLLVVIDNESGSGHLE